MDDLEQRVAAAAWNALCDKCASTPKPLRSTVTKLVMVSKADVASVIGAIIPMVLEHAAKVAEDYDGWETGDSLLTAMAIAAAIRAILQANEPTDA